MELGRRGIVAEHDKVGKVPGTLSSAGGSCGIPDPAVPAMSEHEEEEEIVAVLPEGEVRPVAVVVDPLGPLVAGQRFASLGDRLASATLSTLVRASLLPAPPLVDWAG